MNQIEQMEHLFTKRKIDLDDRELRFHNLKLAWRDLNERERKLEEDEKELFNLMSGNIDIVVEKEEVEVEEEETKEEQDNTSITSEDVEIDEDELYEEPIEPDDKAEDITKYKLGYNKIRVYVKNEDEYIPESDKQPVYLRKEYKSYNQKKKQVKVYHKDTVIGQYYHLSINNSTVKTRTNNGIHYLVDEFDEAIKVFELYKNEEIYILFGEYSQDFKTNPFYCQFNSNRGRYFSPDKFKKEYTDVLMEGELVVEY